MMVPMINDLMFSLMGGDGDDEDAYYNINPWVRRNFIVFGYGNYASFMLPHELRPIYGLGEMLYAKATGRMRNQSVMDALFNQLSDISPVQVGGSHDWFVPDFLKPVYQSYISNLNYQDRPITKQSPFNELDPEWTKDYKSTPEFITDFSKWANQVEVKSTRHWNYYKGWRRCSKRRP